MTQQPSGVLRIISGNFCKEETGDNLLVCSVQSNSENTILDYMPTP